jgi:hypothetical protein
MSEILQEWQLVKMHENAMYMYRDECPGSCDKQRTAACKDLLSAIASHRALHSQLEAAEFYAQAVKKLYEQSYDENKALHSQVAELKRDRDNLFALKEARNSELAEARASITALEAEKKLPGCSLCREGTTGH